MKEIIWSLVPSEDGCSNVLRVVGGAAISVVGCDIGNEFSLVNVWGTSHLEDE